MNQQDIVTISSLLDMAISISDLNDRNRNIFCDLAFFVSDHLDDHFMKMLIHSLATSIKKDDTDTSSSLIYAIHSELVETHQMAPIF